MWITILMQLAPLILEFIKKLLAQERAAAVAGHDGPLTAAIKSYEATGSADAAAKAFEDAKARLPK